MEIETNDLDETTSLTHSSLLKRRRIFVTCVGFRRRSCIPEFTRRKSHVDVLGPPHLNTPNVNTPNDKKAEN